MNNNLCVGGCKQRATHKGWCKVNWISGNKFGVGCPKITEKRSKAISIYRLNESLLGGNPMQNHEICKKNHSLARNQKSSETLKRLGELGLLPQQVESKEDKTERRKNIAHSLRELWMKGKHPRQLETLKSRKERLEKTSNTLKRLGAEGKLPVQNFSSEKKKRIARKVSKSIIEGLKSGRITLSPSWKRIKYKNIILRSQWEKVVATFLDKNKLEWEYETLKINYFDSGRKINTITIPDFYLPIQNIVIEVKSNAEYNSQKTKDKSKAIIKKGFRFFLVGRKEIKIIKT